MPYPKYNTTTLYRVERKKVHRGAVGLSDRIADVINKGVYDGSSMVQRRREESLLLDTLENYPSACFAFTDPQSCLEAIKDPDVLDNFGFCMSEVETRPLVIENNRALFLDNFNTVMYRDNIDFNDFGPRDVKQYNVFPTRIIIPTNEAVVEFSRALPHLHRPEEFATNLIISALPSLLVKKSAPEECVQLLDNLCEEGDCIQQDLMESSKRYSLEEFSTAFLDLCQSILNELTDLGAYKQAGIFPYEIDCDGRERVPGGVKVRKVSFADFLYLK